MSSSTLKRTVASALAGATLAGAAGVPTASAMPADPVRMPAASHVREVIVPAPAAEARVSTADGFDLAAAGIGAAGTGLVAILIAGGFAWQRPSMRRHARAAVRG